MMAWLKKIVARMFSTTSVPEKKKETPSTTPEAEPETAPEPPVSPEGLAPEPDPDRIAPPARIRRAPKKRQRRQVPEILPEEDAIPSLDGGADLFVLMGGEGRAEEPEPVCKESVEDCGGERERFPLWVEPEITIDLHGLTRDAAERRVVSALQTAIARRLLVVRIVTGKGLHSEDGRAVLRETTEALLVALKQSGSLRAWKWEGKTKAKSGAVRVRLPDPR